ncbi:MAG: 2,3-diaminopropionate biosynthesis protein SbnB [Acidobacteriota bacterium]
MEFEVSIVKGKTVYDLVHANIGECVRIVKEAYLAHGEGLTVNPDSHFLRFPDNPRARIIALPAFLGAASGVAGIKWIASFPDNVRHGFPRASAVLVLNDYATGYPFAILESSVISAARTAGSAVLAAEWLNHQERHQHTLGIVGTGLIARYVYRFLLATGWTIEHLRLFDATPAGAETFRSTFVRPDAHRSVAVADDLPSLLRQSSMIVLTTTAGTPHILDPDLLAHCPIVLHLSLRDLAPEILLGADNIVDDVEHVMKANTSPHLLEQGVGHRRFVTGTIAELMTGRCCLDRRKPAIFSPFGLGVLDLAVGKWVYDQAVAAGEDLRLTDFFYDMTR